MDDWKITVVNKTGDGGLTPVTVNFMLFQTVPEPVQTDSWSSAWEVAEVGYPGEVGLVTLPSRVEFCIIDETFGNPRTTRPFDVKVGTTIEVTQKTPDDVPTIEEAGKAPKGQIKVVNRQDNPKPLEFALYKDRRKILSYKDVVPAKAVYLDIKPTIYIAAVKKGSIKVGDDFKAVDESAKATHFHLNPEKPEINIAICQKEGQGGIFFKLFE